jgi:hypothetical protein
MTVKLFSVEDVEKFSEKIGLKFRTLDYLFSLLEIHNPYKTDYYRYHNVYLDELLPNLVKGWLVGKNDGKGNKRMLLKILRFERIVFDAFQGFEKEIDLTPYGGKIVKLFNSVKEDDKIVNVKVDYNVLLRETGMIEFIGGIISFLEEHVKEPYSIEYDENQIRLYSNLKNMAEGAKKGHQDFLEMVHAELKKQYKKAKDFNPETTVARFASKERVDELKDRSDKILKLYPTGNFSKLLQHVQRNI